MYQLRDAVMLARFSVFLRVILVVALGAAAPAVAQESPVGDGDGREKEQPGPEQPAAKTFFVAPLVGGGVAAAGQSGGNVFFGARASGARSMTEPNEFIDALFIEADIGLPLPQSFANTLSNRDGAANISGSAELAMHTAFAAARVWPWASFGVGIWLASGTASGSLSIPVQTNDGVFVASASQSCSATASGLLAVATVEWVNLDGIFATGHIGLRGGAPLAWRCTLTVDGVPFTSTVPIAPDLVVYAGGAIGWAFGF